MSDLSINPEIGLICEELYMLFVDTKKGARELNDPKEFDTYVERLAYAQAITRTLHEYSALKSCADWGQRAIDEAVTESIERRAARRACGAGGLDPRTIVVEVHIGEEEAAGDEITEALKSFMEGLLKDLHERRAH